MSGAGRNEQSWDMGHGEFLDYTVQVGDHEYKVYAKYEPDYFGSRFVLCGPRGSRYKLIPIEPNPTMLFPVNLRTGNPQTVFGGLRFKLTDDGKVRACR